jgi:hypothetical protein
MRREIRVRRRGIGSQKIVGARGGVTGVITELRLAFPIPLVKGIGKVLKTSQTSRLAYSGNVILESIRKAPIVVAGQGRLVPSSPAGMAVEFEGVAGSSSGILVLEGFERFDRVIDRIVRPKKAAEFR